MTVDDVIRAGACADGVYLWLKRKHLTVTVLTTADALALATPDAAAHILRAANLSGYGYGYGDGYGYGYE